MRKLNVLNIKALQGRHQTFFFWSQVSCCEVHLLSHLAETIRRHDMYMHIRLPKTFLKGLSVQLMAQLTTAVVVKHTQTNIN